MSPEEEASDSKKKKEERKRVRPSDSDVLKLQPPPKVTSDLGMSEEEIRVAKLAHKLYDDNQKLIMELAKEEAAMAKVPDPIEAQKSEKGSMEKTAKEAEDLKAKSIRWYRKSLVGTTNPPSQVFGLSGQIQKGTRFI